MPARQDGDQRRCRKWSEYSRALTDSYSPTVTASIAVWLVVAPLMRPRTTLRSERHGDRKNKRGFVTVSEYAGSV
jgi:hypothetical protein